MEYIFKSESSLKRIEAIRKFLLGDIWLIILAVVAFVFACLNSLYPKEDYHIWGTVVLAYMSGFSFLMSGDIFAMLTPGLFTYLIAIRCYNSLSIFLGIIWVFIPLIAIALFNIIIYRKKLDPKGSQFKPMILVSIVVLIGGLGFISAEDYFAGSSIYHMLGMGFGMVFFYCFFNGRIQINDKYSVTERITKLMVVIGTFASVMIIAHYLLNIEKMIEWGGIFYIRWRNNVCTILMIALPFAYYFAHKKMPAVILPFLFYGAMLATGSRGGMIFGTVEMGLCFLAFLIYDKKRRKAYLAFLLCVIILLVIFSGPVIDFLEYTFERVLQVLADVSGEDGETETRVRHYARGIEDFLNHPILGTGLGYMGNRDIFKNKDGALCWYHCEPIQIAASFGIIGIVVFLYQFIKRIKAIWQKKTLFSLTVFLSYIGLELMSLVNPGILCPMPYLLLITLFLVIIEKCHNSNIEQEQIPLFQKLKKLSKKNS